MIGLKIQKRCPECGLMFYPADRVAPSATYGAVVQVKYCTARCKRRAANRRYYQRKKAKKEKEKASAG